VEIVKNISLSHHYLISYIFNVIFVSFLIKSVKLSIVTDQLFRVLFCSKQCLLIFSILLSIYWDPAWT
jgi:hypothetical protein